MEWSVKRLKAAGADAIKFCSIMMLMEMNKSIYKNKLILNALVQNVQLKTSLFLELLSYDERISDNNSAAYAKLKPHKVNGAMSVFSDKRFGVDVLKVEVPVNMAYVEGFTEGKSITVKLRLLKLFKTKKLPATSLISI